MSSTNRAQSVFVVVVICYLIGSDRMWAQETPITTATVSSPALRQHLAVVLDDSGSMEESLRGQRSLTRMEAAKQALQAALTQLPPDTELGIVRLNGSQNGSPWVVPMGPLDVPRAQAAILNVEAEGGTPLGEFMKIAADELLKARKQHHYGDYRLLLVTDGEANDPELVEIFLPQILARGLSVHVIGVDMDGEHSLATRVHSYRRADDESELTQAVQEVFAETGGAGGDADEDAFELLAPLDSDVAAAALAALAETGDEPLDRDAVVLSAEEVARLQNNRPANGNDRRVPMIMIIILLFGLIIVKNAFQAMRKSRH